MFNFMEHIRELMASLDPTTMTRQQVIEFVAELAGPVGPEGSWEEKERVLYNWGADATAGTLDVFTQLIVEPPDLSKYGLGFQEDWMYYFQRLLGEWGNKKPELVVPKLGSLMAIPATRPMVLGAFASINTPVIILWLRPLIEQHDELSDDELIHMIDSLGDTRDSNAYELLQQLRQQVPARRTEVHHEITLFLCEPPISS